MHVIPFSSQTFEGVDELKRIVEEIADDNEVSVDDESEDNVSDSI